MLLEFIPRAFVIIIHLDQMDRRKSRQSSKELCQPICPLSSSNNTAIGNRKKNKLLGSKARHQISHKNSCQNRQLAKRPPEVGVSIGKKSVERTAVNSMEPLPRRRRKKERNLIDLLDREKESQPSIVMQKRQEEEELAADIRLFELEDQKSKRPLTTKDILLDALDKLSKFNEVPPLRVLIQRHPELNLLMRTTLLDWMREVTSDFNMKRETFHLAVSIFDRYLDLTDDPIKRDSLQVLGLTTLLIASKVEVIMIYSRK